jgi:biotin carboxylase
MGLHVIASDGNPSAPGFEISHEAVIVDVYNCEETVRAATAYREKHEIHGVLCIAVDAPRTVAAVARHLGLPSIPEETATLATDKLAMKERLQRDGIPVPWFAPVQSVSELRAYVSDRGFPLVLKPIDNRGARGVLLLTPDVDLRWAFDHARGASRRGMLLLEEFLTGPQVSTETVLFGGKDFTVGLADRNYQRLNQFAPFMVEDGGELPSALTESDQAACREITAAAARSLGIHRGIAKGDLVCTARGVVVIELAARLSGGWFSTVEIPLSTGIDLVAAAILLALGDAPKDRDLVPDRTVHLAQRYLFPHPGRITRIRHVDEVAARPDVEFAHLNVREGDLVAPVTDHTRRAGVVIASGVNRESAIRNAEQAVADITIDTESKPARI